MCALPLVDLFWFWFLVLKIHTQYHRAATREMFRLGAIAITRVSAPTALATRTLAYVSNKRITRIPADIEVDQSELATSGNEAHIGTRIVNRNPRNCEQMLREQKTMGFELDTPSRHYWNKVEFEKKSKHLAARIVHHSGRTIVSVESNEIPIAARLPSAIGLKAAQLLGQILALRALEAGIHSVFCDYDQAKETSSKLIAFLDSLKGNGLELDEQPFIFARAQRDL